MHVHIANNVNRHTHCQWNEREKIYYVSRSGKFFISSSIPTISHAAYLLHRKNISLHIVINNFSQFFFFACFFWTIQCSSMQSAHTYFHFHVFFSWKNSHHILYLRDRYLHLIFEFSYGLFERERHLLPRVGIYCVAVSDQLTTDHLPHKI